MYNNSSENSTLSQDGDSVFQISVDTYEKFAFISNIIVTPIVCVFGLIGNILGLGVLWKDTRRQKLSIYVYLCGLTFFDTVYVSFGLAREIPYAMKFYDEQLSNYVEEHMKLGSIYLDMVFSHSSAAIVVVMSVERLFALVFPFRVKRMWLSKYPCRIIAGCFCFNVIFLLPFPVCFEVGSYELDNSTEYFIRFKEDTAETMDTYMIVQTIVDYFISSPILIVTNIGIAIAYSRIMKTRLTTLHMTADDILNQQSKVTSTVFCITLMYLLLSVPNLFIKMMAFVDEEYSFDGKKKLMFWLFIDVSNLFTYINAANDFVIYILVSNHYRHVFKRMYCKCCIRRSPYWNENGGISSQFGNSLSAARVSTRY